MRQMAETVGLERPYDILGISSSLLYSTHWEGHLSRRVRVTNISLRLVLTRSASTHRSIVKNLCARGPMLAYEY